MRLRDRAALLDILEFIHILTRRMAGVSRDRFFSDDVLQDAVIRRIELIGEASTRLSDEFRAAHPEIPWAKIRQMRNLLIHLYHNVDYDRVWAVTQDDLEPLQRAVEAILASEPADDET